MRTCNACSETKPLTEFHRGGKTGWQYKCKACKRLYNLENKDSIRAREREYNKGWRAARRALRPPRVKNGTPPRLRRHGMTVADLEAMEFAQGGLCAICRTPHHRGLVIDHDHGTGKVRGLLCNLCNLGIGLLRDDPTIMTGAIAYLAATGSDGPHMDDAFGEFGGGL